jgi:pimeloyl-ACP methyl ester carboxylesterase
MSLAPQEMSVPAGDGLILKGTLTYPAGAGGGIFPLAILAHQYPATRDSFSPLVQDLLELGVAALAFDQRGHGASIVTPEGPLVVDTPVGPGMEAFGKAFVSSIVKVGFSRMAEDIVRVTGWGVSQNFIDGGRFALVGGSVGGSGVLLASAALPGLRAVATVGAAGAPAFGEGTPARIRSTIERSSARFFLASSEQDPFDGGANVTAWGKGLSHVRTRLVPGSAHAMAIYFDVRDELLGFLRESLLR